MISINDVSEILNILPSIPIGVTAISLLSYKAYKNINMLRSLHNFNVETLAKSMSIGGAQGSGKSMFAVMFAIDRFKIYNEGFFFITLQGERSPGCRLLDYFTQEELRQIIVFAPYNYKTKGFNILQYYKGDDKELETITATATACIQAVAKIAERGVFLLYASIKCMLYYAVKNKKQITLFDIEKFLMCDEDERTFYLKFTRNQSLKNAFSDVKKTSLDSLLDRLREMLSREDLICAFCDTKGYNLFDIVYNSIPFVADLHVASDKLSMVDATVIAQALIYLLNNLCKYRANKEKLYTLLLDEFYTYCSGIEYVVGQYVRLNRQHRCPVFLIWQDYEPLGQELTALIGLVGNRWYMKLSDVDDKRLSELYPENKGQFKLQKPREYIFIGVDGKTTKGKTKNLPKKENQYDTIKEQLSEYRLRSDILDSLFEYSPSIPDDVFEDKGINNTDQINDIIISDNDIKFY